MHRLQCAWRFKAGSGALPGLALSGCSCRMWWPGPGDMGVGCLGLGGCAIMCLWVGSWGQCFFQNHFLMQMRLLFSTLWPRYLLSIGCSLQGSGFYRNTDCQALKFWGAGCRGSGVLNPCLMGILQRHVRVLSSSCAAALSACVISCCAQNDLSDKNIFPTADHGSWAVSFKAGGMQPVTQWRPGVRQWRT